MRNLASIKVKSNARYSCQECGSTELIQAHHEIPGDDDSLVVLCADCHSRKHPNLPKALFFNRRMQPYWHNKSAASLARELGVCSRTVIRIAKKLEILPGELNPFDKELIKKNIAKLQPKIEKPKVERRPRYPMACDKCGYHWLAKVSLPRICPNCYKKTKESRKVNKLEKLNNLNVNGNGKRIKPYSIYDIAHLAYRLNIPWHTIWHWKRKNRPSNATVEKIALALSTYGSV